MSEDLGREPDETTNATDGTARPGPRTETTMDTQPTGAAADADDAPTARLDGASPDERTDGGPTGADAPSPQAPPTGVQVDRHDPGERAPDDRGVRVGTVVWGLVIAAVGVGLIATVAGARFDVELAVIALVAAAGVALLAGSVAKSLRRR